MDSNSLTGAIPTQLGGLTGLVLLELSANSFAYPPPSELDHLCSSLRISCVGIHGCTLSSCDGATVNGALCQGALQLCGVQLDSDRYSAASDCASAFELAVPSATDPTQCSSCDHGAELLVVVPIAVLLLACAGLALLRRTTRKHPQHARRWLSTAAIVYYHCLNITLITSMAIEWPPMMRQLGRILSLENVLLLPGLECVMMSAGPSTDNVNERMQQFSLQLTQVAVAPVLCLALWMRRTHWLCLLLIFMFLGIWRAMDRLAFILFVVKSSTARYDDLFKISLFFLALSSVTLLAVIFRLRYQVNAYMRGIATGDWPGLSPLELDRRLANLTHRFASHAPNWQFALWLRQWLLLVAGSRTISVALKTGGGASDASDAVLGALTALPWIQLSLSLLIVAVSLWWHRRRQPYAFASQNALEAGLLSSVLFLLLLAIPCHALAAADGTVSPALDAVMTVLVLSSLVGAAFFAFRDLRHQRKHGTPLSLDDQLIGAPLP